MSDVRVSFIQFNTVATDVRVSWLEFDTQAITSDVRVSWLQFDTLAEKEKITYGGWFAYHDRKKSRKEIEEERIALGIIPEPVAKIVTKIAVKAIQKATESTQPDVLEWLYQKEQQNAYERQLHMEMSRQKLIWDKAYERLFVIAVQEALLIEEEMIVMLMMEL